LAAIAARLQRRSVAAMTAPDLGSWQPLSLERVVGTFSSAPFRWWVTGGHALELHLGRSWRTHEDTDIGVVREELPAVHSLLSTWDPHIAAAGQLAPWRGETLRSELHQNNVWCRCNAAGPWVLDVTVGEGSDTVWIYRRDSSVQVPWDQAVLHSADGVPYLAPQLQLLYKSKEPRPKDHADAAEAIPRLDRRQRDFLASTLGRSHPWHRLLG
jgi:hypothetical protein